MSAIANLRLHGDAILAALTAAGLTVGDAEPPSAPFGWRPDGSFLPYIIAYPLPGLFDGTLAEHADDADVVYQLTCVGETRAAAVLLEDRANAILLPGTLSVAGRSVTHVRLDAAGGTRRDDTVQPPVFISTPRYRISTTPA